MITKHIREMAEKRGIKHAHALQKEIKVSPTVAAKLWKGDFEMIGLGTLDKLCRALKCPIGSLLRYEEEHARNSKASK